MNIETRLSLHNSGKVKSTKPYKPWKLLEYCEYNSRSGAIKQEKILKTHRQKEIIKRGWPRSQEVRRESAKLLYGGSSPPVASERQGSAAASRDLAPRDKTPIRRCESGPGLKGAESGLCLTHNYRSLIKNKPGCWNWQTALT